MERAPKRVAAGLPEERSLSSMSSAAQPVEASVRPSVESSTTGVPFALDVRLLDRPGTFSGRVQDWSDWKFRFVNWLAVAVPRFPRWLREVEVERSPLSVCVF